MQRTLITVALLLSFLESGASLSAQQAVPPQAVTSPAQTPVRFEISCYATVGAGNYLKRYNRSHPDVTGLMSLARGLVMTMIDPKGDGCQNELSYPEWHAAVATNQTLTQNGSSASSAGTTSAVEKPGIPALLGLALENGAIKDSVSGNTMTLTSTPMAVTQAFFSIKNGSCPSAICRQLGASATFNVSSDSNSNPATSATRKNVTQWQVKYSFVDTTGYSRHAQQAYNDHLRQPLQDLANSLSQVANLHLDPLVQAEDVGITTKMVSDAMEAAGANSGVKFGAFTKDQQDKAITFILKALDANATLVSMAKDLSDDPDLSQSLNNILTKRAAVARSLPAYKQALAEAKPGWDGAVTFSQQYPSTTVTTSTGTTKTEATYLAPGLVISYDPSAAKHKDGDASTAAKNATTSPLWTPSLTLNAGGSFYPNPLATANETSFRGATTALQLQWTLGRGPFIVDPNDNSHITFSLNGVYSRLQENLHQAGKKADIATGNLKWEIPLPGGVSFPISLTVANSTDQIKKTYVRGNFGLSFDLDKLQQLLKATH